MREDDKDKCKAMIRQAMESYETYNKHYANGYNEKNLIVEGMMAVFEYVPFNNEHRRFEMKRYCYEMMTRLLGI